MQFGFLLKIQITELFKIVEPFLEIRHMSVGMNTCCRILLLASGFQPKDFIFGKTEIHFRPGNSCLLDKLRGEIKQSNGNVTLRFKKVFVAFMRRVLYLRFIFLGAREFSSFYLVYNEH